MLKPCVGYLGEWSARNGIAHLHTVHFHQLSHVLRDDSTVSVVFNLTLLLQGFEITLNRGARCTDTLRDLPRGGRPAVILKVFIHKIDALAEQR